MLFRFFSWAILRVREKRLVSLSLFLQFVFLNVGLVVFSSLMKGMVEKVKSSYLENFIIDF